MSVLVIAEHDNDEVRTATLNAVTAAGEIDTDVALLVAGNGCGGAADECSSIQGVARILLVDAPMYDHALPEHLSPLVESLAERYSHVLAPASTFGKSLLPRVAARLDVQQISDISDIESSDTFVRPIYAGNALATVQSSDSVKLITIRTTAFDAAPTEGGDAAIEKIEAVACPALAEFLGQDLTPSERPELTSAGIVISGGRGMQSGENFAMLERIADKLGAAVGASRAAVDAGYVPNDYQVGQTGKVVAPNLYIAVGISGAIQHLAGMKDSKVIVAINQDEEAPIFQIADYGWVADLFTAIPELEAALDEDP